MPDSLGRTRNRGENQERPFPQNHNGSIASDCPAGGGASRSAQRIPSITRPSSASAGGTEVGPEHIKITDNGIIPMKEQVVDRKYDPLVWLGSKLFRRNRD